jgi:hypothetical protein
VGERPDGRQDAGAANITSYARLGQLLCRRGRRIRCSHRPAVRRGLDLTRILEFHQLPTRAAETLIVLASPLVISTFALVPGQSMRAYGAEIGATGLVVWVLQSLALSRTHKADREYSSLGVRVVTNQLPPLAYVLAGGLLVAGRPDGVYWIEPGILLSFATGIFGAWVLLIEIQR